MKGHGELCCCDQCRPWLYPRTTMQYNEKAIQLARMRLSRGSLRDAQVRIERACTNVPSGLEGKLKEVKKLMEEIEGELTKMIGDM